MIHISINEHQEADVKQLHIADTQFAHELSSTSIIQTSYRESLSNHKDTKTSINSTPSTSQYQQIKTRPSLWPIVLILTYITYVVLLICGWAKSFYKMCRFIKGKPKHKFGRWISIVIHDEQIGPFSWLNYVVLSSHEDGFARKASILHEISHVKNGHAIDIVFILAVQVVTLSRRWKKFLAGSNPVSNTT